MIIKCFSGTDVWMYIAGYLSKCKWTDGFDMLFYRTQNGGPLACLWFGLIVGDLDWWGRLLIGGFSPLVGWCSAPSQPPLSLKTTQSNSLSSLSASLVVHTSNPFSGWTTPSFDLGGLLESPTALTLSLGSILLHVEPWVWLGYFSLLSGSRESLVGVELYPTSSRPLPRFKTCWYRVLHWALLTKNWRQLPCACMPPIPENPHPVLLRILSPPSALTC